MHRKILFPPLFFLLLFVGSQYTHADSHFSKDEAASNFVALMFLSTDHLADPIKQISVQWEAGFTPIFIELMSLSRRDRASIFSALLRNKTGQDFGLDSNRWFSWWWKQKVEESFAYAEFKSMLYGHIDEKFKTYFSSDRKSRIRLDEVRWGGVLQDGIPPLRQPKMQSAESADYMGDENIVFGIEINGDARAYPKRILAWHEMFVDKIGGIDFAGVYCTLCGAVILYKTNHDGIQHDLGTSGFLFRSNKLMYDQATQSLWNTTWGEPVIGPLVDQNILLERSFLVTTTWAEWKRRHPQTTVLSLQTGYTRDYGEGVAYQQYFVTDELMFSVSTTDARLKNKDEILALTFPEQSKQTMAIAIKFLKDKPVYSNSLGPQKFVIFTDASGANRVYQSAHYDFVSYDQDLTVTDKNGEVWILSEDKLKKGDLELSRLPAHRAFWFGWYSAYPETILIDSASQD